MSMTDTTQTIAKEALEKLLTDGYVIIENLLDPATTADLRDRVQRLLDHEKANPFDPGPDAPEPDEEQLSWYAADLGSGRGREGAPLATPAAASA